MKKTTNTKTHIKQQTCEWMNESMNEQVFTKYPGELQQQQQQHWEIV